MKMPAEAYNHMRDSIAEFVNTNKGRVDAFASAIRNGADNRVKDPEERIRWDLCHAAKLTTYICRNVYPLGMNDTHVDTALRRIVKELGV